MNRWLGLVAYVQTPNQHMHVSTVTDYSKNLPCITSASYWNPPASTGKMSGDAIRAKVHYLVIV